MQTEIQMGDKEKIATQRSFEAYYKTRFFIVKETEVSMRTKLPVELLDSLMW